MRTILKTLANERKNIFYPGPFYGAVSFTKTKRNASPYLGGKHASQAFNFNYFELFCAFLNDFEIFDPVNFFPVTQFLVTPLLVTSLLFLVTPQPSEVLIKYKVPKTWKS